MLVGGDALRVRSRGLDSDTLCDLPEAPLSGLPAPKKKRRKSKTSARQKKTTSSILLHPWQKAVEKESLQLSTPPGSKKRPSKCSSTQMELFSSAGITKPMLGPMKLITTEDALKSKCVRLGQTTMEKLASYRFQPAIHSVPDVETSKIVASMEGVVEGPEMAHEICHITTSHEEENPYHLFHDHGPTSPNEGDLYPTLDDHDLTNYIDDELNHEFDDLGPTSHNEQDPSNAFDEANLLGHDDDMIMIEEKDTGAEGQGTTPAVQSGDEDDFPVDGELETEMAQLLMPDQTHKSLSPRLLLSVLHKEDAQSRDTSGIYFQLSNPTLHAIVGDSNAATNTQCDSASSMSSVLYLSTAPRPLEKTIDWPSIHEEEHNRANTGEENRPGAVPSPKIPAHTMSLDEIDDYSPLEPFARPPFPAKVRERSPITSISSSIILRTCFRIGEALREGALCEGLKQDAIIELFARVKDSSCDTVTRSKLYFEFADLFHDRPPFIRGTLENSKISSLQETESRMLLGVNGSAPMTRCLGRLKRAIAGPPGWMLYIINIRPTDWEEVRWTRQIAGAGMAKQ